MGALVESIHISMTEISSSVPFFFYLRNLFKQLILLVDCIDWLLQTGDVCKLKLFCLLSCYCHHHLHVYRVHLKESEIAVIQSNL